jgi:hypothetical protein
MSEIVATSSADVKQPGTRKPVPRTLAIIEENPLDNGMIRITVRGKQGLYRVRQIPCDPEFGPAAFQFQKLAPDHVKIGTPYSLSCSSTDPAEAVFTCDCPGQIFHGHCRHADALRVLMARRPK